MAEKMIAYCGLVCTKCPAYIATQAGDQEGLERVAAQWSKEFHAKFTAADCLCDGCTGGERLSAYCGKCEIRACAVARGVINCAHCDDYGCEKLTGFFKFAPEAQAALETLREVL
jgi:hypothetical protein